MTMPHRRCRACIQHGARLYREFGRGAMIPFALIGARHGLTPIEAFTSYMDVNHELGHPSDADARELIRANDVDAAEMMRRWTQNARSREPHPFVEVRAGNSCGHGACGRDYKDKVHSFFCPQCERRSWLHKDIEQGYCGHCHAYTGLKASL